jgi:signal transduction histidine kinase
MPLDLAEFLAARTADMQREGLPVRYESTTQSVRMMADAGQLGTALRLLVSEAAAQGAKKILIASLALSDGKCQFHILDDRLQIPSTEHAASAFELNFEWHDGGLGLKLPLAKKIVELHGGQVAMQTNAGQVDVTISLPVA